MPYVLEQHSRTCRQQLLLRLFHTEHFTSTSKITSWAKGAFRKDGIYDTRYHTSYVYIRHLERMIIYGSHSRELYTPSQGPRPARLRHIREAKVSPASPPTRNTSYRPLRTGNISTFPLCVFVGAKLAHFALLAVEEHSEKVPLCMNAPAEIRRASNPRATARRDDIIYVAHNS